MALYEHVLMVRQDATPQQVDALLEQMKTVLETGGGKVAKTENWGLRTIAYRIRKNRKAHYALVNIDAPWKAVEEMERQLKINEDVLRFITVKVEALEEGPSAMLQRRERDERRGDRDERRGDRDDRGRDRPERGERRRRDEFGDEAQGEEAV